MGAYEFWGSELFYRESAVVPDSDVEYVPRNEDNLISVGNLLSAYQECPVKYLWIVSSFQYYHNPWVKAPQKLLEAHHQLLVSPSTVARFFKERLPRLRPSNYQGMSGKSLRYYRNPMCNRGNCNFQCQFESIPQEMCWSFADWQKTSWAQFSKWIAGSVLRSNQEFNL